MLDRFLIGPGFPFHFWTPVFFVLGAMVGSFLNVCIHRMPRGESLVRPPSHCPACGHRIPWRLNLPIISWIWLRGRCRFCQVAISPRYLGVELLTALLFTAAWVVHGEDSWTLPVAYCIFLAGLVAAAFIDLDHYIIPDEITLGGLGAGLVASFAVPALHRATEPVASVKSCVIGAALGWAIIYGTLRLGKLLFGRQRFAVPAGVRAVFGETDLHLPDRPLPYDEVFCRESDTVKLHASRVELVDRCFWDVEVRVNRRTLTIGSESFPTEQVPGFEVETTEVVVPREAMGLGDVKFMAAIGAFLGWQAVLFSLFASAAVGAVVGVLQIALLHRDRARPIPFGPYLALAAAMWVFAGDRLLAWWRTW